MYANNVIYCEEKWHATWDWHPRDWCTFGWHKLPYDEVVYKALNLGPLSVHNDWVPIEPKESK
jgi:hypothetical protein